MLSSEAFKTRHNQRQGISVGLLPSTESAVADSCSTLQFRVKEVTLNNIRLLPTLTQIWVFAVDETGSNDLLRPSTASPHQLSEALYETTNGTARAQQGWGIATNKMQTKLLPELQEWTDQTLAVFLQLEGERAICILFLYRKSSAQHIWKTDSTLKTGLVIAVSYLVLFPIHFKHRNGAFAVDFITWWMFPNTFCLWPENKVWVTLLF